MAREEAHRQPKYKDYNKTQPTQQLSTIKFNFYLHFFLQINLQMVFHSDYIVLVSTILRTVFTAIEMYVTHVWHTVYIQEWTD